MDLVRFTEYSRKQIHDHFDPESPFLAQTGTWGLHGVVRVPRTESDWVFFVTFAGGPRSFAFEEAITNAGVLSWQSQPRQRLSDSAVQRWIRHDSSRHHIYLFLRVRGPDPYLYMGQLDYVSHDPDRECPVFFQWQIRDFRPPDKVRQLLHLPMSAPPTRHRADVQVPSVQGHAAVALVTRRHVFVQWHSRAGKPVGTPVRFRNSLAGLRRFQRVAPATSLALMWTDAARLSWDPQATEGQPPALQYLHLPWNTEAASIAHAPPSSLNALLPGAFAALLRNHPPGDEGGVPAKRIERAVRLSQRWLRDAARVRDQEQHIKSLLARSFPGFTAVCRDWRTKSALWILENYPTPTDVLQADVAALVEGVSLATAHRVGLTKVERLRTAAVDAALLADPTATGQDVLAAIREWRRWKATLVETEGLQASLGDTGRFPAVRTAPHPRAPRAPEKRPGGRYHVASPGRPRSPQDPAAIVCQRYSTGWRLLLRATSARRVRQQDRDLMRMGGDWILKSAHPVEVDHVPRGLPLKATMIFRLAKQQDQSPATMVKTLSHRHDHVVVVADGGMVSGGQPEPLFGLDGWQAFWVPEGKAATITDAAGHQVAHRPVPPRYDLTLSGTRARGVEGRAPLFLGAFPAVEGDTNEPLQLVLGQEGRGLRRWREDLWFSGGRVDLPTPPAAMGWYFLRVYDQRQVELESHEFFWIRDLVRIDAITKPSGTSELGFVTAGALAVSSSDPTLSLATVAENVLVAEIPLHPQFDVTHWSFSGPGRRDHVRNLGVRLARTVWALADETAPEDDLAWTTTAMDITMAATRPTSRQVLYLSVSRRDSLPTQVALACETSTKTVPLKNGRGLFPLRNLATAVPLDTRTVRQALSITLTVRADAHATPEVLPVARLVPQYRCGKCGTKFPNDRTGLERHVAEEHPVRYYQPIKYDDYLQLALQAKMVPNLPQKVYVCGLCSMVVRAERSAYINPTSVMSAHWNGHQVERPGVTPTFNILATVADIAAIANLILPPLIQCLECHIVMAVSDGQWSKHEQQHHGSWIVFD